MGRNIFLYTIVFIAFISGIKAQEPLSGIKGIVLDQASEAPIPYAVISILDSDPLIASTSDEEGHFTIDNLPVGRYNLEVRFLGYEPSIINGVLVSSGKSTTVKAYLKESTLVLQQVEIRPKRDKEVALNKMAVVSARQLSMEEAGRYAGGFDDPARLVASFAGVASNLTTNGIVIRGNAPKGLLWRIEGVQVPNPNHFAEIAGFGGGGITALSSRMLASSDFFTGAFPAEYGNALSGVFDLSIRNGSNDDYEHTFQAGFMGIDVSSEGPLKKGGRASYLFNYRYSTFGLIDVFLPKNSQLGIAYQDLSFKLHFPTKKAGAFSVWGLGLIDRMTSEPSTDTSEAGSEWTYYEHLESDESSISMGVLGLTHKYFFNSKTYLKTILSASGDGLRSESDRLNNDFSRNLPVNDIRFTTSNYTLSTLVNHKFSARHTNRTGVNFSNLNYNIKLREAPDLGQPLETFVKDDGSSFLFQGYSQSSIALGRSLSINPGIYFQHFVLNGRSSIEPRLAAKWQFNSRESINIGYGLHSQVEKLNFYLAEVGTPDGVRQVNKELDFSKAHHFVIAYDRMLGAHTHLRIEPYVQLLYDVPVIADSSFSFINLEDDFFVNDALVNEGEGRNIGIDLTLERFLHKGWYYLFTASIFDSQYRGGDGQWRDTRFNKQFVGNALLGKEWTLKKKNQLGASLKLTYFGGDRIHPVDVAASHDAVAIVEDYSRAFEDQKPDSWLLHLTFTYRINKEHYSSLWSLQLLNALGSKEHFGYRYNFRDRTIDPDEETVVIPNLSYKIEF